MGKYADLFDEDVPASRGKYADLFDEAPATQAPPEEPKSKFDLDFVLDRAPITSEVREISGQLSGSRPSNALKAGLSAASLAALPLTAALRVGTAGARLGYAGIKEALGAGAGAAALGGAAELADAPAPVQMGASILGGLAGGRASMPKGMPSGLPVPEMPSPSALPDVPPPSAVPSLAMGGKVSKTTRKEGAELAKQWLGGSKPSMGMLQELESPGSGSMARTLEFRMVASDKAQAALNDIADKTGAIANKLQEFSGVSMDLPKGKAGSAIYSRYEGLLDEAGKAIGEAEDAVKSLPAFDKVREGFREPILAELGAIAKENRLTGMLVSRVPSSEKAFFQKVTSEAKKIGSIHDVMEFRRWLRNEIKDSQTSMQMGSGDFIDALESRIYQAVDKSVDSMPMSRPEKAAVGKFLESSRNYYTTKFSPEAKNVRAVLGFKGAGLAPDASPEQIVDKIFKGSSGLAGKMQKAAEAGLVDQAQIQKAAWARVFEDTIDKGKLNANKLRSLLKGVEPEQGQFLFGDNWARLQKASEVADLVTYAERYGARTGFGADMIKRAEMLPGGIRGLAQTAYTTNFLGAQNLAAPGNLLPAMRRPDFAQTAKAALPSKASALPTTITSLRQAMMGAR